MIGQPEGEAPGLVASCLVGAVQRDGRLPRPAEPADDAQLTARDHRLVDENLGCRCNRAAGERNWR
jgi:hypothetical protein